MGSERFAKRHRLTLYKLRGTDFGKTRSDSTTRQLLAQLDVPGLESLLPDRKTAQPGVTEEREALVCDGKTLRWLDRCPGPANAATGGYQCLTA